MRKSAHDWAELQTDDEFYPGILHKKVRPAKWNWEDVDKYLAELSEDPIRGADRRFVALVNADTGNNGCSPGLFIGIQVMNPGEHIKSHRHNSVAIYHILQGEGYSMVGTGDDRMRIDWKRGDTFVCPGWNYHEHFCTGDEQAMHYVVQDMITLASLRALLFEEPAGVENIGLVQEGFAPHIDTPHDD
jgi:gentisate 1,2-dioxygenase